MIDERTVQKVGDLVIEAPIGVEVDPRTGAVLTPVRLEVVGTPVMQPTVLKDKLINEGLVRAKLIVENDDPCPCPGSMLTRMSQVAIPVQSVLEIPGIMPGDEVQESVEVEHLSVFGLPEICPKTAGKSARLILKVILRTHIVIAREEIICIPVHTCPK